MVSNPPPVKFVQYYEPKKHPPPAKAVPVGPKLPVPKPPPPPLPKAENLNPKAKEPASKCRVRFQIMVLNPDPSHTRLYFLFLNCSPSGRAAADVLSDADDDEVCSASAPGTRGRNRGMITERFFT